jgi:hypothetical protein
LLEREQYFKGLLDPIPSSLPFSNTDDADTEASKIETTQANSSNPDAAPVVWQPAPLALSASERDLVLVYTLYLCFKF